MKQTQQWHIACDLLLRWRQTVTVSCSHDLHQLAN